MQQAHADTATHKRLVLCVLFAFVAVFAPLLALAAGLKRTVEDEVYARLLVSRPLPSFVTSMTVPDSAISPFAPVMPMPAARNFARASGR